MEATRRIWPWLEARLIRNFKPQLKPKGWGGSILALGSESLIFTGCSPGVDQQINLTFLRSSVHLRLDITNWNIYYEYTSINITTQYCINFSKSYVNLGKSIYLIYTACHLCQILKIIFCKVQTIISTFVLICSKIEVCANR